MKPITAWAITNHGKIPQFVGEIELMCVFSRKAAATGAKLETDSVVKVEIREVESKPIPPTRRKHHYCR